MARTNKRMRATWYRITLEKGYGTSTEYCLDLASYENQGVNQYLCCYEKTVADAQLWWTYPQASNDLYTWICNGANNQAMVGPSSVGATYLQTVVWNGGDGSNEQLWYFIDTGRNATKSDGSTVPIYNIKNVGSNQLLHCDTGSIVDGTVKSYYVGTDYDTETNEGNDEHGWIVEEAGYITNQGVYEIHSYLDSNYVLDVSGPSNNAGALLQLYTRNGNNNQKFQISQINTTNNEYADSNTEEIKTYSSGTTYYMIKSLYSGMPLTVQNNGTKDGLLYFGENSNIEQWPQYVPKSSQNSKNSELPYGDQFWTITTYDDITYNGQTCQVVGIISATDYKDDDSKTYYIDDKNALVQKAASIHLHELNQNNAERWILVPSATTQTDVPLAYDLGVAFNVGEVTSNTGNHKYTIWYDPTGTQKVNNNNMVYPRWRVPSNIINSNKYSFMISERIRMMYSERSVWDSWSSWTSERPAIISKSGTVVWDTVGLGISFDTTMGYKAMEIEYRVRTKYSSGSPNYQTIYGSYSSYQFTSYFYPTWVFHTCAWGVDGLRFDSTTNYNVGENIITITSIYDETLGKEVLTQRFRQDGLDCDDSFVIPIDYLSGDVLDGHKIRITYHGGTDMWGEFYTDVTAEVTVSTDVNHGLDIDADVSVTSARCLHYRIKDQPNLVAYISIDGQSYKISTGYVDSDGYRVFDIPYPFGKSFDVYISAEQENGNLWGYKKFHYDPDDGIFSKYRPAHIWTWTQTGSNKTSSAILEMRANEPLNTQYTVSAEYTSHVLNSREWKNVNASATKNGEFSAEGALAPSVREGSDIKDFEEMMSVVHVIYRSPSGRFAYVAATKLSITEYYQWTSVTVDMIQEESADIASINWGDSNG